MSMMVNGEEVVWQRLRVMYGNGLWRRWCTMMRMVCENDNDVNWGWWCAMAYGDDTDVVWQWWVWWWCMTIMVMYDYGGDVWWCTVMKTMMMIMTAMVHADVYGDDVRWRIMMMTMM